MTYNDEELIQITESLKQEWLNKAVEWLKEHLPEEAKVERRIGTIAIIFDNAIVKFKEAMEE